MIQKYTAPFDYYIIDNFLNTELAQDLSREFLNFDSERWFSYESPLEVKKTISDWYSFPPKTYQLLTYLNSAGFVEQLEKITGVAPLFPDQGLHGAGWHIHGAGGKLNVHQDYSIHPKLELQRKFNLIIYLSQDWQSDWGGNLEFWSHNSNTNQPSARVASVECKFNRAVIFDSSQNSWHGFNDPIACPVGHYRKSIAMYYLCYPGENADPGRRRALYSAADDQRDNQSIQELINRRMQL